MKNVAKRRSESGISYVRKVFLGCLEEVLASDTELFLINAHERAICHRLALYMEMFFTTYDVDCEYDRLRYNTKSSPIDGRRFVPDIIVHERLVKNDNLLVVDAKCTETTDDVKPSGATIMMMGDNDFEYRVGVFVKFHTKKRELRSAMAVEASGFWLNADGQKGGTFKRHAEFSADKLEIVNSRKR